MVWAFTGCGSHPPETDEEKSDRVEREQLPEVRKMAEAGNAEAQYRMGLFAFLGKVVPQSTDEAILWWRKAADQKYLPAEHDLGVDYCDGKIVPQDLGEGIRWLRKVAEQGEEASGDITILGDIEDARTRPGMAYWYGTGVKRDYAEAVKWHLKAAEQGDGLSQQAVAEAYAEGKGVKRDYVQAHKWANLAAVSNSRFPSQQRESEKLRASLASEMTPKQIEEAAQLARDWKPSKQAPKLPTVP